MATIIGHEELLRRATQWITEARAERGKPVAALIDEAAMKFNLGPKDAEFLNRFFKEHPADNQD
jgi:hypothetical protein